MHTVDLWQHVIVAGGKDVPLVNRSEEKDNSLVCFVSVSESIEIPASCQVCLTATVSGGRSCMAWSNQAKFMNEYGLVVAHSLSPVISGRIMIQVLNPHLQPPVMVSKNVSIGTVKPVQDVCCKVYSAGLQEERMGLAISQH